MYYYDEDQLQGVAKRQNYAIYNNESDNKATRSMSTDGEGERKKAKTKLSSNAASEKMARSPRTYPYRYRPPARGATIARRAPGCSDSDRLRA